MQTILLFGGVGVERLVSVATAQHVSEYLSGARHWFLDPSGVVGEIDRRQLILHANPFTELLRPRFECEWPNLESAIRSGCTEAGHVLFIALHGEDGESGALQEMCDEVQLPYTGSGATASAGAFNKAAGKLIAKSGGLRVVESIVFKASDPNWKSVTANAFKEWGAMVVKPRDGGSSIGLHVIRTEQELERFHSTDQPGGNETLIVERFVIGREFTVGVIERVPGGQPIALPPSEVIVDRNRTFDYAGKYLNAGSTEVTPAQVDTYQRSRLMEGALLAHHAMGCRGYSRTDFIFANDGLVFLETNTLPGLTRQSFIPQQLQAAELPFAQFVQEQIQVARLKIDSARIR